MAGEGKLRLQSFGIHDTTTPTEPSAFLMRIFLSLIALSVLTTCTFAQTSTQEAESNWAAKLEALNKEYFEKLKQLQAEQIESLESMRKKATTQDRLDEAIQLRDLIDKMKAEMGAPALPEDNSKLNRDKARVANVLRQSKWNCSENPNLSKWFGKSFVFHENGTIVPSSDVSAKLPHHRWAILDSRTVVGMFGDYMIVFRLNEKGNALDVFENGNCIETKAKRHGFVVQSASVTRALRDGK